MSSRRRYFGKDKKKLKFSKNGRPLCRFCEQEVRPPKRTFCSTECVHQWKLRRSGSYIRKCLFARDHGICAICGIDTVILRKQGRRMELEDYKKFAKSVGMPYKRKTWYDADHIIPVVEGGGQCDLSNIRTLCCRCHREETRKLTKRLTLQRKMEKIQRKLRKTIVLAGQKGIWLKNV